MSSPSTNRDRLHRILTVLKCASCGDLRLPLEALTIQHDGRTVYLPGLTLAEISYLRNIYFDLEFERIRWAPPQPMFIPAPPKLRDPLL